MGRSVKLLFIASLFLSLAISACTTDGQEGRNPQPQSGNLAGGFRPDEALSVQPGIIDEPPTAKRSGTDRTTGMSYFYDANRHAEINSRSTGTGILEPATASWIMGCSVDRMTDQRRCHINPALGGFAVLSIDASSSGNIARICVLGHDFPGEVARIRVDDHQAISTDTSGCARGQQAATLASQMTTGSQVLFDFVEWPYSFRRSKTLKLDGGFSLARELFLFSQRAPASLFE